LLPGARAPALLTSHREELATLSRRHGLTVRNLATPELYAALAASSHQRLIANLDDRNPVALLADAVSFWMRPRLSWGTD